MISLRLLLRGFTRRCPVCGAKGIFHRWFKMAERCPRCDLEFERIDGHLSGALGINTVVSIVVLLVVGIAGFVLTFPELPLAPLVSTAIAVSVLFPIFFYPFSKTVWTAIDLRMRPPGKDEVRPGFGEWIGSPPDKP
ncbi:MAG: DUF983 domain-containing protein [Actinomycetota bacterium]|nr:DUF983 domain-containing protein [Actinomycetota bacterium]